MRHSSNIPNFHPRLPRFDEIDFGEDDANIEFEIARRTNVDPIYVRAFLDLPNIDLKKFKDGTKFLIHGQKGTGKTAIFRKLQHDLVKTGAKCSFIVFRDEVASQEELDKLATSFAVKINEIKKINHHFYVLERLILMIIASHLSAVSSDDIIGRVLNLNAEDKGPLKKLLSSIVGKSTQDVIQQALDSAQIYAKATRVDAAALSGGTVEIDGGILLRESNKQILHSCIEALKISNENLYVFVDEVHFSYKDNADHDGDAALVRDLIRAVNRLNKSFFEAGTNCKIFAAIRSEFLFNPLIAGAELHTLVEGHGVKLSWASFNADFSHPMFDIGARRVEVSSGISINGRDFMRACFANFSQNDAKEFVQATWSKPRDMVRFLRTCKYMFGGRTTLSMPEYRQAFRESCSAAFREIETALTSFLSIRGVERLKTLLSQNSSLSLSQGSVFSFVEFVDKLSILCKNETHVGAISDPERLARILYMLGVVYTSRKQRRGPDIMHSFHRGQEHPDLEGRVAIHRAIAKAFS